MRDGSRGQETRRQELNLSINPTEMSSESFIQPLQAGKKQSGKKQPHLLLTFVHYGEEEEEEEHGKMLLD